MNCEYYGHGEKKMRTTKTELYKGLVVYMFDYVIICIYDLGLLLSVCKWQINM